MAPKSKSYRTRSKNTNTREKKKTNVQSKSEKAKIRIAAAKSSKSKKDTKQSIRQRKTFYKQNQKINRQNSRRPTRKKAQPPGATEKVFLIRYKEDLVTHICPEKEIKFKNINGKTVAFGKFSDNRYYQCDIIMESTNFAYLLSVLKTVKERIGNVIELEHMPDNDSSLYYLVRFLLTKDYYVCSEEEIKDDENGMVHVFGQGGLFKAQVIATGKKREMLTRLDSIQSYLILATPEKQNVSSPLFNSNICETLPGRSESQSHNIDEHGSSHVTAEEVSTCTTIDKASAVHTIINDANTSHTSMTFDENITSHKNTDESNTLINRRVRRKLFTNQSNEVNDSDSEPFSGNNSDVDPAYEVSHTSSDDSSISDPGSFLKGQELQSGNEDLLENQHDREMIVTDDNIDYTITDDIMDFEISNSVINSDVRDDDNNTATSINVATTEEENPVLPNAVRRRNACTICGKLVTRIVRHYQTVHKDTERVTSIMALSNRKQRDLEWKRLRIDGNFKHNCRVIELNRGEFIVERRYASKNITINPDEYLPCHSCRMFLRRTSMHKHVKKCSESHKRYDRVTTPGLLLLPHAKQLALVNGRGYQVLQQYVLGKMKDDKIARAARRDELVLKWGALYCFKNIEKTSKTYLAKVCSYRMRALGRLLVALQKLHGKQCTLREFIDPTKFDSLIKCIQECCGYSEGAFAVPSLPLSLGYLLLTCANIIQGEASRERNSEKRSVASEFIDLYNKEYAMLITSKAHDQLKEEKYVKKTTKLLPFAEDILTLMQYLQAREKELVESLTETFSNNAWIELGKILLGSMIVFNRKRVGDVQRILIENYSKKVTATPDSSLYQTLNSAEKLIANSFVHFFTRGKKDSLVPIMIPKKQLNSYELLLKYRKDANVSDENIYLFGKADTYMDGCQALRELSKKSGAKNHQLLRSTALRKHLATMSQILNLEHGELNTLAEYMGHNLDVHRNFYRLPDQALHLSRISKLLAAVSTNNIDSLRGKTLEELPMPDGNTSVEFIMPLDAATDLEEDLQQRNDEQEEKTHQAEDLLNEKPHEKLQSGDQHKVCKHRYWSFTEREAVFKHLAHCLHEKRLPRRDEAQLCAKSEKALATRSWRNIKDFIRNLLVSRGRNKL